jgi:mono/diheme cytochrome c family protein
MKNRKLNAAVVLVRRSLPAVWMLLPLLLVPAVGISAQEDIPKDLGKIAMGRTHFRTYCASCHGREGRGDGSLAEYLRVAPADLTQLSAKNGGEFPFEEVRKQIDGREVAPAHGSDMPVWGDAFEKVGDEQEALEEKILALVHYLRSLQAASEEGQ